LARGDALGGLGLLLHEGDAAGDRLPAMGGERPAVERHRAGLRPADAGHQRHQAGLAGTVRADDAQKFAGAHVERDVRQDGRATGRPEKAFCRKGHRADLRWLRMSAKAGAPNSAVMTPMGSTWPGMMTRDSTSAAIMKTAPISAEAGSSSPCRTPTTMRAAWGMTSPTKPIDPTMETMTAVISAETAISTT